MKPEAVIEFFVEDFKDYQISGRKHGKINSHRLIGIKNTMWNPFTTGGKTQILIVPFLIQQKSVVSSTNVVDKYQFDVVEEFIFK